MTILRGVLPFNLETSTGRRKMLFLGGTLLAGMILGLIVLFVPQDYLLFALAGLIFAYFVFFKIEVAITLALFIQIQLSRFNYMGGGTPFHPNGIMGLLLIVGAVHFLITHPIRLERFKSFGGAVAFLVVAVLSLIDAGTYLMDGITVTLRLVTALAIYAVLVQKIDSLAQVKWIIGAIIAAQVYPTIAGLLIVAGKTGLLFTDETMRLGNSGVGVYLAMISIMTVIFFFGSRKTSSRFLWAILSALFLTGLFFSYGRSGWIGFALGMALVCMIRFKRLVFILPLVLILLVALIPAFGQRFADLSFGNQSLVDSGSTFSARLQYWQAALSLFPDHPILGVGLGVGRYRVGDLRGLYPFMIHNDYVSVLLETGLIGFILFILWNYQWVRQLIKINGTMIENEQSLIALAVLTVFVSSLVMRITDNIILDSYDMYPICALVASAMILPYLKPNPRNEFSENK